MKKLLVFTAMMVGLTSIGYAQKDGFKFSVGAELGLATGSFKNSHSVGIGGSAQVEVPLQERLNAVAYGGILVYNGKSIAGQSNAKYTGQTIIPVRIGVKYFLAGGVYGAFQTGLGFLGNYYSGTAFAYSPQVGYEFKTKSDKAIDATFKYDGYSKNGSFGMYGIRLAYIF